MASSTQPTRPVAHLLPFPTLIKRGRPFCTSTIKPVLDCVSASITHKRTNSTRPSHTHRIHPQQNGKSAHIAAAAWLGFAKPNPCRTTSPTTKSTICWPLTPPTPPQSAPTSFVSYVPSTNLSLSPCAHNDDVM